MSDLMQAAEAPVAPAQPAAAETPAPEQTGQTEQQQAEQQTAEERKFSQAELDAAVAKRIAKERRRFERELRTMVEAQQAPQQQPAAGDEPKRDAFQDYESYLEARAEYRAKKTADEHVQRVMQERAAATAQADLSMAAQDVIERGRAAYKDFDAQINAAFDSGVIQPGGPLHQAMVQSEDGHAIAYHLATHPQDALRLAQMPTARQLIELGRLSARMEKMASAAPPPPKPVSGTSAPVEKDFRTMTPAEHAKWRRERRRGA